MSEGKQKLLIVEDETYIRELYVELFEDEGLEVTAAEDGKVAEKTLRKKAFDLTLLDILLPFKSGLELLEEKGLIRENMGIVLLLTNLGQDEIIKKGYTRGVDGFLIKSALNPGEVVREVRTFLSRYRDKPS